MIGQVFKIHSDFYYVNTESGILECKLRNVLKKAGKDVFVGDMVKIEDYSKNSSLNFVTEILSRKNYLLRPKVANISQSIIVSSVKSPDINFEQLDRFIALSEYNKIKPVLCFNKCDIEGSDRIIDKIKEIYSPLGYEIYFISALYKIGTDEFLETLKDNVSIFYGSSGVGKSSIVNSLSDSQAVRVGNVSLKSHKGVHTTRHCEIFPLAENIFVVDTPGFSNIKFDFLMPNDVKNLFPELKSNNTACKYKDCLHIDEDGCNIINNTDIFSPTRYESYAKFIAEAKNYKNKVKYSGIKTESRTKYNLGKNITKISDVKRTLSRKVQKQNLLEEYHE